jgi:hypothetical protein
MPQGTSQQGENVGNRGNIESLNIDYGQMCQQLRSLQNSNSVPEQYRQALNNAITILTTNENVFNREIQARAGQGSQTRAASTGQGTTTGTTGTRGTRAGQQTGSAGGSGSGSNY